MKKTYTNRYAANVIPFPNAATSTQRLQKALDWALTAAASAGIVSALIFLMLI